MWHLIALAREAGIDVASVSHGTCRVELRQTAAPAERTVPRDPRQAIYEQFGGDAYRRMKGAPPDTGVRGEDYEPALGAEQ